MKLCTHLFIEHKVKLFIDENYSNDFGINILSFGNVLADMSYLSATHPHYQSKSMDFVTSMIKELCEYIPRLAYDFGAVYLIKLGIVTHYLSDFFCKAHASDSLGNPKEHILYEFALNDYVEKNYCKLLDTDFTEEFTVAKSFEEIEKHLKQWLEEYHSTSHSYEKDIFMAMRASCYVTASVMEVCFERKRRIFEFLIASYSLPKMNTAN